MSLSWCRALCYFVLVFFSPFGVAFASFGGERANLGAFHTFVPFVLVLVLSVSSSTWWMGRPAVCDCGTPWTFLLPFLARRGSTIGFHLLWHTVELPWVLVFVYHSDYLIFLCFRFDALTVLEKKGKRKVQGVPQSRTRSPSQTPRGRGNRQIQISTNQTNIRKALRLTLSSPSEVIAILKGLKNTKTKWHMVRHATNRLVE